MTNKFDDLGAYILHIARPLDAKFNLQNISEYWQYKVPTRIPFNNKNVQKALDQLVDENLVEDLHHGYYRVTKKGYDFEGFDLIREEKVLDKKLKEKQLELTEAQLKDVQNVLMDYPKAKTRSKIAVVAAVLAAIAALVSIFT